MKMTVKRFLGAILMVSIFALSACTGSAGETSSTENNASKATPQYLSFGVDAGGGSYSMIASAITKILVDKMDYISFNIETTSGGGAGNIRKLGNSEVELGIATTHSAYEASAGIGDFENETYENVRIVLAGFPQPNYFYVPANSSLEKITDLKGKRIGANSAANASTYTPQVLAAHGLNNGDYEIVQLAGSTLTDAFKDGSIDCIMSCSAFPYGVITELSSTGKGGRFLKADQEALNKLVSENVYWSNYTIPANSYEGQTEDVQTVSLTGNIYSHKDVDEKVIYDVTKLIVENIEEISQIYDGASYFNLENQKNFFASGLDKAVPPLHEGAKRYLQERGLK